MSQSRRLVESTIIYTIGNLGSKILAFLLIPLYTYYLTKAQLGYFDLVVVTVTLFVPFVTLQLSDSIYRWLLEGESDHDLHSRVITNSLFAVTVNVCAVTL